MFYEVFFTSQERLADKEKKESGKLLDELKSVKVTWNPYVKSSPEIV